MSDTHDDGVDEVKKRLYNFGCPSRRICSGSVSGFRPVVPELRINIESDVSLSCDSESFAISHLILSVTVKAHL